MTSATPNGETDGTPRKKEKRKRSFLQGVRERLESVYDLGRTLVEEPRAFPGRLKVEFLNWVRATWNARGGGFYACGFVVTFVFLEIKLLFTELFTGTGGFIVEQILHILLRFTVDSLVNTLLALIWPAIVLGIAPVWGAVGMAVGYLAFPRFIKDPLSRFLSDGN